MFEAERKRPDAIDFVAIVTPNHLHLPVAEAALQGRIPGDERQAGHCDLRRSAGA